VHQGCRRGNLQLTESEQGSLIDGLAVVVNFFVMSHDGPEHSLVTTTTSLGLQFLKAAQEVDHVLLVDGSAEPDPTMKQECARVGVEYHHCGRLLTYVESYNIGWRRLPYRYIGLMANDVLPHPTPTIGRLLEVLKRPDVGCTFPYMSSHRETWDEVQRPTLFNSARITCEPATMTLNLNLFKRALLERMQGLDNGYLTGFQESRAIVKIRNSGFRVVMVKDTRIFHFDRLNKSTGQSEIADDNITKDAARWREHYPQYGSNRAFASITTWKRPFATTPAASLLWFLTTLVPFWSLRRRVIPLVLRIEPLLCRYPAVWGAQTSRES
jgi:hypothetical protein